VTLRRHAFIAFELACELWAGVSLLLLAVWDGECIPWVPNVIQKAIVNGVIDARVKIGGEDC